MDLLTAPIMLQITELGNVAVAVPGAAVGAICIWRIWGAPTAIVFAVNALALILATVLLKFVSAQLGGAFKGEIWELSKAAPSGHMVCAMIAYAGTAALLAGGASGMPRLLLVPVMAGLAGLVGYTRVALHAHTVGDVLAAAALGSVLLPLLVVLGRRRRIDTFEAVFVFAAVAIPALMLQLAGVHFESTALL